MAVELRLALRGQLRDYMRAESRAVVGAVNSVIGRRVRQTKERLRRNVRRAFETTNRLPFLIRSEFEAATDVHPHAVGRVFSTWVVKQRGIRLDLFRAFEKRQTITADGATFLIVPAPGLRTANRRALLAGATLIPFYQRGQRGHVARRTGKRKRGRRRRTPLGYVVFQDGRLVAVLLRTVRLKRRDIHIDREFARAQDNLDVLVVREIDRRMARVSVRFGVAA